MVAAYYRAGATRVLAHTKTRVSDTPSELSVYGDAARVQVAAAHDQRPTPRNGEEHDGATSQRTDTYRYLQKNYTKDCPCK